MKKVHLALLGCSLILSGIATGVAQTPHPTKSGWSEKVFMTGWAKVGDCGFQDKECMQESLAKGNLIVFVSDEGHDVYSVQNPKVIQREFPEMPARTYLGKHIGLIATMDQDTSALLIGPIGMPGLVHFTACTELLVKCTPDELGVAKKSPELYTADQLARMQRMAGLPTSESATIPTSPSAPPHANPSQNSIQAAIDRIAQGRHQELPQPLVSSAGPGQDAGWTIENGTSYPLHLYLSGPMDREYVIPIGNSLAINLASGSYRIAADVPDRSVLPYYAVRQLQDKTRWMSRFYIAAK